MAEEQIEISPEEEARLRWEQVLRGKSTTVVETVAIIEESNVVEDVAVEPESIDDSPEAVLARLYKDTAKAQRNT
jgi:hypothetical protein